jgi:hypothetical protein
MILAVLRVVLVVLIGLLCLLTLPVDYALALTVVAVVGALLWATHR